MLQSMVLANATAKQDIFRFHCLKLSLNYGLLCGHDKSAPTCTRARQRLPGLYERWWRPPQSQYDNRRSCPSRDAATSSATAYLAVDRAEYATRETPGVPLPGLEPAARWSSIPAPPGSAAPGSGGLFQAFRRATCPLCWPRQKH